MAIFIISIQISLSSSSESHDDDENGGPAHIPGIFNSTPCTTSAHHADINVSTHNPQPESEESESVSSILEVVESEESTQIDLDCESTFDQPHSDSSFINLVMQSLDVTHSDTLSDLQRPSCRVLFDAHCSKLSSTQMKALLSTDSGVSILRQGQCLELFPDFSTFTLSDFALFPTLTVGKIRDLSTVPADLLLQLINLQGYSHVGHLNRFPSAVGDRVFHSTAWLNDLHIWELFTIEGILGMNTDNNNAHRFNFRTITKYAAFLFNRIRFEKLLSSSDGLVDAAPLLTRWSIQSEEFLLFYIEYISARRSPGLTPLEVDQARRIVNLYTETRLCLFQSATNHKWSYLQKINKTRKETKQLIKLDILIEFISTPLTWRFSKALQALKPVNTTKTNNISQSLTPMTRSLISALKDFSSLLSFYHSNADCFNRSTDEIFGHFILLHDIKTLTDLSLPTTHHLSDAVPTSQSTNNPHNHNNNNNILVTLRRLLLQLLSPHSPTSSLVQDALTFIFSTSSTNSNNNNNSNGNSFEVTRWFRQAHDLDSFYIFDHLIRHFSHEFDVAQEIAILLKNPAIRHRLFHESKSLLVKLLAALNSSSVTVYWNLVHDFPETVDNDIPNVVSLLHLDPMKSLLLNPSSDPRRHTPLEEEEEIQNHNSLINTSLQASLRFLQALTPITPPSAVLTGFLKADFRVQFSDDLGVDAGGLRRTWLSSLFKIFGDELRLLFPENPAQTGRLPAPFIQPQLFSFLGLLHGKALQIGVKPDWFFSHDFAINFLLQQHPPPLEEEEEQPGKVDLDLVELLYPNVFEIFDLILQLPAEEEALDYFNSSNFPTISSLTKSHHSFSSHFVFDAHHFAKMTTPISTVTVTVESLNEIKSYRSAIISLMTSNLLTSRQHYWASLSLFFSPDFLPSISPQFIFDLLNPPQVKIDEIISKMEFSDTCNTIWIIDDHHVTTDDDVGEGNSNTIETETKTNDLKSNKNNENNQNNDISSASPNALLEDSEDNNDTHKPSEPEPHVLLNITAREAFLRILRSSYTSPKKIESLLSFTTGSLQIPPAGLDDLKFHVHCYQTPSPAERLSKSHTCYNILDFHSSLKMSDTMEAFELSILSSSGFGFS